MAATGLQEQHLPPFSKTRFGWFMAYVRWFFRRHFHALRLLAGTHPEIRGKSVVIYTNHPGWWDPLIFLLVAERLYPDRLNYGPIDSAALGKYRFLESIGFLGIEPGTWRGSKKFLRYARASQRRDDTIFWITAAGSFVDTRVRPVPIRPGVAHVASGGSGLLVPMAMEYPYWNERLPEAVVAFGEPIDLSTAPARTTNQWHEHLCEALTSTQDRLAAAAMRRDPQSFETLAIGREGVGTVYDTIRWASARLRGRAFDPSHSGSTAGNS
jgi:1-acyl-sn-glycerol-3-phosphate acyltransferase